YDPHGNDATFALRVPSELELPPVEPIGPSALLGSAVVQVKFALNLVRGSGPIYTVDTVTGRPHSGSTTVHWHPTFRIRLLERLRPNCDLAYERRRGRDPSPPRLRADLQSVCQPDGLLIVEGDRLRMVPVHIRRWDREKITFERERLLSETGQDNLE